MSLVIVGLKGLISGLALVVGLVIMTRGRMVAFFVRENGDFVRCGLKGCNGRSWLVERGFLLWIWM